MCPSSVLVVGNGSTMVDGNGSAFVHRHTAEFLVALSAAFAQVSFAEIGEPYVRGLDLLDTPLPNDSVRAIPAFKKQPATLARLLAAVLKADFVYVFFPGTLPRIIVRICTLLRKPYGLYLRGEQFAVTGADARAFRCADFVCSVAGLCARIQHLTNSIVPVRPMLDIDVSDAMKRNYPAQTAGPWKLLFVGRLEESKGVVELVEAVLRLQASGFDCSLSLVGGGPLFACLYERFGNTEGNPIQVRGLVSDKAKLLKEYERADIFILPSHHEGFPRVLYEAMIKAMVIVTTFVGGIPGVMRAGFNCVEIPVGDSLAIDRAIIAVTSDVCHMKALSCAALRTVLNILNSLPTHYEAFREMSHRA